MSERFVFDKSRAREHLVSMIDEIVRQHDERDMTIVEARTDISNEGWGYSYRYDYSDQMRFPPSRQTITITIHRVTALPKVPDPNQPYRTNALYNEVLRAREDV